MKNRTLSASLTTLALGMLAASAHAADPAVAASWQEQKASFTYFGITSTYSCSGMEGKVKQLLTQFGARKDNLHVSASGCDIHDLPFDHSLNVDIRFSTLVPLDPAAAPGTTAPLAAQWTAVEITPHRPSSMGEGDCELIEQLRDLVGKSLTSRNLNYQATCTPHQLGINSYSVRGEFLKAPIS